MEQPMNIIQCKCLSFYHSSIFWLFMQVTSKMPWHYNSGEIPTCQHVCGVTSECCDILTSMKIESYELVLSHVHSCFVSCFDTKLNEISTIFLSVH